MATQVTFGAYKGFGTDFTAIRPPNPSCCSDPSVLCPQCAALALRQAGVTTCNESGDGLTANVHPSGLTPVPPPCEQVTPPRKTEPCRPCDEEQRPEPMKYSPEGARLTYMPPPAER